MWSLNFSLIIKTYMKAVMYILMALFLFILYHHDNFFLPWDDLQSSYLILK